MGQWSGTGTIYKAVLFSEKIHTSNGTSTAVEEPGENQENIGHLSKSHFFMICQMFNLKQQYSPLLFFCSLLKMPLPEVEIF